jgi:hypothetical protein
LILFRLGLALDKNFHVFWCMYVLVNNCLMLVYQCSAMDAEHSQLLLHTEVRWLSRGRVLQRFYELEDELLIFFTCEESDFARLLSDDTWCTKVAFLADIFGKLYFLNKGMQGKRETILTSTDKIISFQQKLSMWIKKI